ncbi:MAG: hypothetical protein V3W41_17085 [Planctomycetota bacterium]
MTPEIKGRKKEPQRVLPKGQLILAFEGMMKGRRQKLGGKEKSQKHQSGRGEPQPDPNDPGEGQKSDALQKPGAKASHQGCQIATTPMYVRPPPRQGDQAHKLDPQNQQTSQAKHEQEPQSMAKDDSQGCPRGCTQHFGPKKELATLG